MKRLIINIILSFFTIASFGQSHKAIAIDSNYFFLKDSIKNNISFEKTIKEIQSYCSNDTQRLSLIAGWIFNNIDFDLNKLINGGVIESFESVYSSRQGACGEYSTIFSEFCNRLGIENEIIEGYVPEYNSENNAYYETNHAWNVVKINGNWYHCDLLGFSGYLNQKSDGEFEFIKETYPSNFLTQDISFIVKNIPADPMWQLSNYPLPLDTILKYGLESKIDSTQDYFDYKTEIENYIKLTKQDKLLKFADDAYMYNNKNNNIIIVNYYNATVDLINNWKGDKQKLILARKYLLIAKSHLSGAKNGVENLGSEIDESLSIIKKYIP